MCSPHESALTIAGLQEGEGSTYYLARLKQPGQLSSVLARFSQPDKRFGLYEMWSSNDFASRSQLYWLLDTGAGVAVLFMAGLVCLVGAMITSQSLKTVITSYSREYATLNALGASRFALAKVVVEQSCWIGSIGLLLGYSKCTVTQYCQTLSGTGRDHTLCHAELYILGGLYGATFKFVSCKGTVKYRSFTTVTLTKG